MDLLVARAEREFRELADLYRELLAINCRISEFLSVGDWDALSAALSTQTSLQAAVDGRQDGVGGLRMQLAQGLGLEQFALSALKEHFPYTELDQILLELMEIMEQLQAVVGANETSLRQMIENVQLKMDDLQKGQKAAKAYQPQVPGSIDPRFVDEKK